MSGSSNQKVTGIREAWRRRQLGSGEEQQVARLSQGTKGQERLIAAIDHALGTASEPSPHGLVPAVLEGLALSDRDAAFREALRVCIELRIYERQREPQLVRIESEKVRKNRLRRAAGRQGLRLSKSRRRDPHAYDYGGYMIVNASTNGVVAGASPTAYNMNLDDVEDFLLGDTQVM